MDYRFYVKKYEKLPVQVEAMPVIKGLFPAIREWLEEAFIDTVYLNVNGEVSEEPTNKWGLVIKTLEGELVAKENDYIIKGVKGEFYPIRADILYNTYKAVEEEAEEVAEEIEEAAEGGSEE